MTEAVHVAKLIDGTQRCMIVQATKRSEAVEIIPLYINDVYC